MTETPVETTKKEAVAPEGKKKKTFWGKFVTFLSMGGFIVILIVGVAIAIGISLLVSR
jgi:hypothetical protein